MKKYDKLVRDNIPEIIHKNGHSAYVRTLSESEFIEYLEKKLDEEVAEFHKDKTLEELVDIAEVVCALAEVHGHSIFELRRARLAKFLTKGGFEKRICLIEVEESEVVK